MEEHVDAACGLCHKQKSKYKCPKCCILYCSLQCYQSFNHSSCSEQFYKQCIVQELKGEATKNVPDKDIKEIIKREKMRVEEDSVPSDSDDDSTDLDVRLKNVDLDDPDAVWERLNDKEKSEFESALKSGKIFDLVPQ